MSGAATWTMAQMELRWALEDAEKALSRVAERAERLRDSVTEAEARDMSVKCWLYRTGGDEPDTKHHQAPALRGDA